MLKVKYLAINKSFEATNMKALAIKEQAHARFTLPQILEGLEGITIILACYLTIFLKPLRDRWGLSKEKATQPLPGDELIKEPKSQFTHAIEINAPAKYVWPWVAQIGQGRGGFYSYEALENLSNLNIYNSDEILPEFQNHQIGDLIPFGTKDAYPLEVYEHGKAMVIAHRHDMDNNTSYDPKVSSPTNYFQVSWLWYVEPMSEHSSRFISRNRVTYASTLKNKLMFGALMEPIIFTMDRKMCYGIKKRAERLYRKAHGYERHKKSISKHTIKA